MINTQLEKIGTNTLQDLINNAVQESKTIEYKKLLPGNSDSDKKEFLADVSSFSNTVGGDLLYGIVAEKGIPTKIEGITIPDVDAEILKYENILREGIEPRIPVAIRAIEIEKQKYVFVFRMNKSWIGPHRVTFKSHDKFYARNSAGKYSLDVSELWTAFNASQTLLDKISNFKADRIMQLTANITLVPFSGEAKMILHIIPFASFTPENTIPVSIELSSKLRPIMSTGWNCRINIEGLVTYSGEENYKLTTFTQLYGTGIIEAVCSRLLKPSELGKNIPSTAYEDRLLQSLPEYLRLLKELNITPPFVVFLTFIGVNGYQLGVNSNRILFDNTYTYERDILQLPETIVESYETDPVTILRSMFDLVWNAFGYERSFNFDEQGKWIAS